MAHLPSTAPLSNYPDAVQAAYARFMASGDLAAVDTILEAVISAHLPKRFGKALGDVLNHHRLQADLGFDSLSLAQLIFFLEDVFGIETDHTRLPRIVTVGDLRAHLRRALSPASGNPERLDAAPEG